MQYGVECYCGSAGTSNYAKHGKTTGCAMRCPGDHSKTCECPLAHISHPANRETPAGKRVDL
jgi:hypothetical protein